MGTEIWHMSDPPEGYFPVLWPCFIGCVMNKHLVSFYKNWSNSYSCVYFIWPTHWTPIQLTLADHARLPEICLKYFHAFFLITSTHAPKFQWSHPDRIVSYSEYLLSAMWLGTRLQITSCTVGHLCKLHKLHTVEQHHQRRHVTAMALRLSPPLPRSLSVSLPLSRGRTHWGSGRDWSRTTPERTAGGIVGSWLASRDLVVQGARRVRPTWIELLCTHATYTG